MRSIVAHDDHHQLQQRQQAAVVCGGMQAGTLQFTASTSRPTGN